MARVVTFAPELLARGQMLPQGPQINNMSRHFSYFFVSKSRHLCMCCYSTQLNVCNYYTPKECVLLLHTTTCVTGTHLYKLQTFVCTINTPFGVYFACLQKCTPCYVLSFREVCSFNTDAGVFSEITYT